MARPTQSPSVVALRPDVQLVGAGACSRIAGAAASRVSSRRLGASAATTTAMARARLRHLLPPGLTIADWFSDRHRHKPIDGGCRLPQRVVGVPSIPTLGSSGLAASGRCAIGVAIQTLTWRAKGDRAARSAGAIGPRSASREPFSSPSINHFRFGMPRIPLLS